MFVLLADKTKLGRLFQVFTNLLVENAYVMYSYVNVLPLFAALLCS